MNQFSNDNARGSKISCMHWVNETAVSLLMVGSDDGVVRLWRNPHQKDTEIVSAWIAVRNMSRGPAGLVINWQQATGQVVSAIKRNRRPLVVW